jgi:hypothetical protein
LTTTPAPQPQSSTTIATPDTPSKPSPSVVLNTDSHILQSTPLPTPKPPSTPSYVTSKSAQPSTPSHVSSQFTQPSAPISIEHHTATNTPAPRLAPQPVTSRSGILHYQGRPVPLGGVVYYDNLPKARLKFTFDHSSWQISLRNNPDGTRKGVQLTSIKQGLQANCDLGWEIMQ